MKHVNPIVPPPVTRDPITVCEVWSRDGLQGWPEVIPTAAKRDVITGVVAAGVREVDVTSFVSPKVTAQFGDAAALLEALRGRVGSAVLRALAVNGRSFENIVAGGVVDLVDVCGFPISASDAHNRANLGKSRAEQQQVCARLVETAGGLGLEPLLCIATAFGCPLEGVVTQERVLELAAWAADLGVRKLMLGDTTGMADPRHAFELFAAVAREHPAVELFAHFHDTRGSGIANTLAAIGAGVRTVDSSLGGVGGEPPTVEQNHSGEAGNVCTEDLVALLDRMGFQTGIDVPRLLEVGLQVEDISGRPLRSQVQRAGVAVAAR